jgi:hypothetical protein
MTKTRAFSASRLCLLLAAVLLSTFAIPAAPASAGAICDSTWVFAGSCCLSPNGIKEQQQQTCCSNGSCYTNTRCTSLRCPV